MTDQAARNTIAILTGERDRIRAEYDAYFSDAKKREAHLQSCISHEIDKRQAQVRDLTTLHHSEMAALRSQLEALTKAKEVSLAECGRLRELLGEVRPLIPSKMSCRDNGRTSSWYDANDELRDRIDAQLRTGKMVADPAKEEAAKVEAMAKEIYDKFHFTPDGDYKTKPAWVDGGNSIMQDEARKRARAILKTQSSGPGK